MKDRRCLMVWAGAVFILLIVSSTMTTADDRRPNPPRHRPYPPMGIYVQMTEDFYRALKEDTQAATRTFTTNMSEDYLHQIATATRYTVETNLQLLQQQERIIQLLEALQDKPVGGKP